MENRSNALAVVFCFDWLFLWVMAPRKKMFVQFTHRGRAGCIFHITSNLSMKKSVYVITACLQTYRQRGNTWIAHFKCSLLKILVLYLLENLHFEHLNAFLRFLSKFILKHNECGQAILAQSGWCFFELWRVWACQWCRLFHMTAIALCERSVGCCALKPPAHAITLLVVEDSSLNHTWLQYFNLKRSLSNPNFFIACLSSTLESALLLFWEGCWIRRTDSLSVMFRSSKLK